VWSTLKDFHPRSLEPINEALEALWKKELTYHTPKKENGRANAQT